MVPLGLSIAVANGVGNLLGEGQVSSARHVALLAFPLAATCALAYALPVYFLAEPIVRAFSSDEEVISGALQVCASYT